MSSEGTGYLSPAALQQRLPLLSRLGRTAQEQRPGCRAPPHRGSRSTNPTWSTISTSTARRRSELRSVGRPRKIPISHTLTLSDCGFQGGGVAEALQVFHVFDVLVLYSSCCKALYSQLEPLRLKLQGCICLKERTHACHRTQAN